ncbi:MAG TPA: TlpA disulfide reductase family protein, partial [Terracidiphilus sp.]|nr:TlpA disulfide reductase family protein [Terracidiphilus sp.]
MALAPGCDRGAHPALTGKPAPDFTISDGSTTVHLADYRGSVVLLNFWWSQCAPCIAEMPSMLELHHDRPDLAILAVSIDDNPDAYSRFLVRHHVDLITVRDPA